MPRLGDRLLERHVPVARGYLVEAARAHRLVFYHEVMEAIGTSRAYIGQVLDELNRREHAAGRPLISAIVVLMQTRRSSDGLFGLARELGRTVGDERTFWQSERDAVWAVPW